MRRPVTVCELSGLPLTVVGYGCHPSARGFRRGDRGHPQGALQTLATHPSAPVSANSPDSRGIGRTRTERRLCEPRASFLNSVSNVIVRAARGLQGWGW